MKLNTRHSMLTKQCLNSLVAYLLIQVFEGNSQKVNGKKCKRIQNS